MSGGLIALVVVIVFIALLVIAGLALWDARRRRSLQQRFGPEYDRAVEDADSGRAARRELRERVARREELEIRELSPSAARRYQREWLVVQQQFVDEPTTSVTMAHRLVRQVMSERGYPIDDRDERMQLLSVDHADVMDNYRAAADIESRGQSGRVSTEELRQAMQHYRALFDRLLGQAPGAVDVTESEDAASRRP